MGTRFLRVPTINVLSKNKKNIKTIHLKMNIFTAVKYCCILHGRVCVMPGDIFLALSGTVTHLTLIIVCVLNPKFPLKYIKKHIMAHLDKNPVKTFHHGNVSVQKLPQISILHIVKWGKSGVGLKMIKSCNICNISP